jgi:4-hydroxy-tetrahydrodipicolinate synthase
MTEFNPNAIARPRGVFAAGLTLLNEDLSIDATATIQHTSWLLGHGCDGVLIFGTTGEANSFTVKERLVLIDALGRSKLPKDRLMIGTGCCAVPDTIELTRRALSIGVTGALVLPPFYYKNVSDDGLFAAIAQAIEGVADPRLKIYLYHFPALTGVPYSHAVIERLLKAYPGTVAGIKDSSGDFTNMKTMIERFPGFDVFSGTEEYLLDVLRLGGVGTISATCNVTCEAAQRVYANWKGPDADRLQATLTAQRKAFAGVAVPPACKAILVRHGGRKTGLAVRPPFTRAQPEAVDMLMTRLEAASFALPALAA